MVRAGRPGARPPLTVRDRAGSTGQPRDRAHDTPSRPRSPGPLSSLKAADRTVSSRGPRAARVPSRSGEKRLTNFPGADNVLPLSDACAFGARRTRQPISVTEAPLPPLRNRARARGSRKGIAGEHVGLASAVRTAPAWRTPSRGRVVGGRSSESGGVYACVCVHACLCM